MDHGHFGFFQRERRWRIFLFWWIFHCVNDSARIILGMIISQEVRIECDNIGICVIWWVLTHTKLMLAGRHRERLAQFDLYEEHTEAWTMQVIQRGESIMLHESVSTQLRKIDTITCALTASQHVRCGVLELESR